MVATMRSALLGVPLDAPTKALVEEIAYQKRTETATLAREWIKAGLLKLAADEPKIFAISNRDNVPIDALCKVQRPGRAKK
jgi:hypothetical protein